MKILIVGGGALGYFLSQSLVEKGHRITIVNRRESDCLELSRRLNATIVKGDGTRSAVLEDAGIRQQDAVFALTSRDEDNLVICQFASEIFGVKRALASVNDPQNEPLFNLLGVRETFSVTSILCSIIQQRSAFDSISRLFRAFDGTVEVAEAAVQDNSPSIGVPLKELGLPKNTLIAAIGRRSDEIIPNGESVLLPGDHVLVVSKTEVFTSAMQTITGET